MRSGLSLGFFLGFGPGAALGIGRFAYALVLPDMQMALGLSYAQAGLLGSANTAGYLVGALVSHRVLYAVGYRRGFYASLLLQAVSLALLAVSASFPLLFALRFVQRCAGRVCVRGRRGASPSERRARVGNGRLLWWGGARYLAVASHSAPCGGLGGGVGAAGGALARSDAGEFAGFTKAHRTRAAHCGARQGVCAPSNCCSCLMGFTGRAISVT